MPNGIKFGQVGVDIKRGADHEMSFSSEWPTVHVLKGGSVTNTVSNGSIFYQHNLGFVPAFIPYIYNSSEGSYEIFRALMGADENNIYYYTPGGAGGTGTFTYGIFIYNINLTENYEAPQSNPTPASVNISDQPYGLKIANGVDISSKDLQDFTVNTDARAPLIHAVYHGYGTDPGSTSLLRDFSCIHDLPYNPMFLPFIESQDYPGVYINVANFAGTTTSGQTITISDILATRKASVVILKDPFDVSENTIDVTI